MNILNFSLFFKLSFILSGASASFSFSKYNPLGPRTTPGAASNNQNSNPPAPFKLESIHACAAADSKESFVKAIEQYVTEAKTAQGPAADNAPSDVTDSQAKTAVVTDLSLSPDDLCLKKLNVLFNCPKANEWLSTIQKTELTKETEIPKVVTTALQSKLAEFPYGSLQSDVDESLVTCVIAIKKVDHEVICKEKICKGEDMDNLKKNLSTLKSCHHNFMAETLNKLINAARADPIVAGGVMASNLPRTEVADVLKNLVDTLPAIKSGGILSPKNPTEETSKKCRANLKQLLGIVDSDDPSIAQPQPQQQQQPIA